MTISYVDKTLSFSMPFLLLYPNLFFSFLAFYGTLRVLRRKEQERRDASRRRVLALVIGPSGGQRCDEDVAACSLQPHA